MVIINMMVINMMAKALIKRHGRNTQRARRRGRRKAAL